MKICNHGTCLSRALFLLGGLMSLSAIHAADSQQYRGFTIDVSRVRKLPNLDAICSATQEQIDSPRGRHELRWWLLGKVGAHVMLVRYTHRPGGIIRIIGAGYWQIGAKIYEEQNREH